MENQKVNFEYTYSAGRQKEIETIRKKYLPKEEDKMELLRQLDKDVTKPGTICSLVIGILGCLLFGFGMCCSMVWGRTLFVLGIIVGLLGMGIMCLAYPIYEKITKKQREMLAPQILALIEELSK
ncbi:MAG: hypothetical protein J6K37_02465 [Lachnospiraceae bacterium]|nr:hypothetical protein [Lachnospiraceae bacterium]